MSNDSLDCLDLGASRVFSCRSGKGRPLQRIFVPKKTNPLMPGIYVGKMPIQVNTYSVEARHDCDVRSHRGPMTDAVQVDFCLT